MRFCWEHRCFLLHGLICMTHYCWSRDTILLVCWPQSDHDSHFSQSRRLFNVHAFFSQVVHWLCTYLHSLRFSSDWLEWPDPCRRIRALWLGNGSFIRRRPSSKTARCLPQYVVVAEVEKCEIYLTNCIITTWLVWHRPTAGNNYFDILDGLWSIRNWSRKDKSLKCDPWKAQSWCNWRRASCFIRL